MSHENMFFAEKELCAGRLNDRIVDRRSQRTRRAASEEEEAVCVKGGVVARVRRKVDPTEPVVAVGAELLAEISAAERRALLQDGTGGVSDASRSRSLEDESVAAQPATQSYESLSCSLIAKPPPRPPWARRQRSGKTARGGGSGDSDSDGHDEQSQRRRQQQQQQQRPSSLGPLALHRASVDGQGGRRKRGRANGDGDRSLLSFTEEDHGDADGKA
jgi:hypothetical protein